MISACYHAYVLLSTDEVGSMQRISWHRTALDSVRDTFSELTSIFVAKIAFACASTGIGMSFFGSKKWDIIHRGFVVLHGWADAFALPKAVFTQFKTPSALPPKYPIK